MQFSHITVLMILPVLPWVSYSKIMVYTEQTHISKLFMTDVQSMLRVYCMCRVPCNLSRREANPRHNISTLINVYMKWSLFYNILSSIRRKFKIVALPYNPGIYELCCIMCLVICVSFSYCICCGVLYNSGVLPDSLCANKMLLLLLYLIWL